MTKKTLFLAWQDKARTRHWFPVGRLDVGNPAYPYRFSYVRGAERARAETGFEPLLDFPDFHRQYDSSQLFPLFQNRVLTPGRGDFQDYLRLLDLRENADPIEILSVSGGERATDSFEVFPKLEREPDGTFRCRFFLHGWRHVSQNAQQRVQSLKPGEPLHVALELTNPTSQLAVQIQTEDYYVIGWSPHYLVSDLVRAIAKGPGDCKARVVRLNPVPAPARQRLLVEFCGRWPDYEPMTQDDFQSLVS